jgi:hypothetical protein
MAPILGALPRQTAQQKSAGVLKATGRTPRAVDGFGVTLHPFSTGVLEISFHKSDAGEYFFLQAGGCEFHRDLLFSLFRETGNGFTWK